MSRLLFTKYWMLAHIFMSAGILSFSRSLTLGFAIWAVGTMLIAMFYLPPILKGESFWIARQRVKNRFAVDAVLWMGLAAVLYLLCQLYNARGLTRIFVEGRWEYPPARATFLPSAIAPFEGDAPGVTFVAALAVALVCAVLVRCALPRKQRLALLLGLSYLTGAFAITTFFCPTWSRTIVPAFEGSLLWFLMFCVSIGIVVEHFLEKRKEICIWALVGAGLNIFGLMCHGTPGIAMFGLVLVIFYFFFALFIVYGSHVGVRSLWTTILIVPVVLSAGLGLALEKNEGPWYSFTHTKEWSEDISMKMDRWSFRNEVAGKILDKSVFYGHGPDAFKKLGASTIKGSSNWKKWKAETEQPNDFMQFLIEQGLFGTLLILLPILAMIGRCLLRLMEYLQSRRHHYSIRYVFVAVGASIGLLTTFLAAFVGNPFHTPFLLCTFTIVLSTLSGWLPRKR